MTNKQELINWMEEIRENLPFENKVQLIWDFWHNKDKVPQLEKYVQDLETDNQRKDDKIRDLEDQITEIQKIDDEEQTRLKQEITEILSQTGDRIAQLDQTVKGSALIFQKQNGIIATLRAQLVKEQSKSGASKEFIEHCKEDIKRLDEEKQELDKHIQELKTEETENKDLRDKELADLKAEKQALENELEKEKGWWDKWINDNSAFFVYSGANNSFHASNSFLLGNPAGGSNMLFENGMPKGKLQESKRFVRDKIYQYYRDK